MSDTKQSARARSENQSVVVERTYRASVQELWELWTTKEGFESWWGPEGFRVDVHALEARLGGRLHYDMIADAPEQVAAMKQMGGPISHETRGTFSELTPFERLELTHVIDFLPGVEPYESIIQVAFFPSGEHVRMVVTLGAHLSQEVTNMSVEGFRSQLGKLDRRYGWKP